jgi:hypothetical protein
MAGSDQATTDMGDNCSSNHDRSSLVFHHGLVRNLPGQQRNQPRTGTPGILDPFVAADLGNFFGGGVSSWLIKRGWPVVKARKAVVVFGGLGMTLLIPTIFTSNLLSLAGLFAVSTFAYASFSTMALVLPSDLYRSESVADC